MAILKEQALYNFWSSFGVPAYEENSVPTGAKFPYLTYQVVTDSFDVDVVMTASIWDRNKDGYSAELNNDLLIARISEVIGKCGMFVPCGDDCIWIRRGQPFAQSMGDSSDDQVKRKLINISAEFISVD